MYLFFDGEFCPPVEWAFAKVIVHGENVREEACESARTLQDSTSVIGAVFKAG